MHSFKILALGALALAQKVVAQSTVLFFTSSPTTVAVGQAVTVTYTAPNLTAPVTIVLRKGDPANFGTVGTVTTIATNGTFTYVPSANLAPGADYALQIVQGGETNYGHIFTISAAAAYPLPDAASSLYTIQTIQPTANTLLPANATTPPFAWPVPTGLGPVPGNGSVVYLTTTPCASGTGVLPGYAGANATVATPTLSAAPAPVAPTVTSVDVSTASAAASASSSGSVTADAVAPVSTGAAGMVDAKAAFVVTLGVVGAAFALL